MVLNLHIRFVNMGICTFILMGSLPAAWIAVGCFLLILLLIVTILFLLKSHEVATLKKQCEDLNETMRMMRYEEANLSRMLHTASTPVAQPEASAMALKESNEDILVPMASEVAPICNEVSVENEELQNEQVEDFVNEPVGGSAVDELTDGQAYEQETRLEPIEENVQEVSQEQKAMVEELAIPQLHKQAINERRPAIPNDLFAAWFAENEDTSSEELVTEELEKEEKSENIFAEKNEEPVLSQEIITKAIVEVVPETIVKTAVETVQNMSPESSNEEILPPQDEKTTVEASKIDVPVGMSKEDERFCRKLERIVNTRLRNPNLNIDIIAAQFGIGRTNFYRKVRELTGISPNDYLRKCRMERAAELLCNTEQPVNDVCAQVGIPDAQYFSRVFKAHFGVSPSVYREQHNQ